MRTQWERDAKVRFRISLPSFEKIDSQIPGLKKTDLNCYSEIDGIRKTCPHSTKCNVGCVFQMVVLSIVPYVEFGGNDHREGAPSFQHFCWIYDENF